jgi:ligand-binding sensor domain-containing protein
MNINLLSKLLNTLLLTFSFVLCSLGQDSSLVKPLVESEESISKNAKDLPEFKSNIHASESEGNQISGVVRTVFQDSKGNFWFGTQNGLCRKNDKALVYFDLKDNLGKGVTVTGIIEGGNGMIWIGHSGGISKYDGQFFTSYSKKNGLINDDVWFITLDKKELLWIGTREGLCTFDGNEFKNFDLPESKSDSTRFITSSKIIHCIYEDRKGRMWVACNGGAYILKEENYSNLSEKDGLCSDFVNTIIEDKNGNMWFSSAHNGLCKYDGKSFTNITDLANIMEKRVGNILEDSKGNIWFAVHGQGVYKYDGQKFVNFSTFQGLFGKTFQIYEDQQSRIWFVGFGGAYRMDDGEYLVNVTRDGPW